MKLENPVEVLKAAVANFEEAEVVVLRLDSAMRGAIRADMGSSFENPDEITSTAPVPMDIGNFEVDNKQRQREIEIQNNVCLAVILLDVGLEYQSNEC